MLSKIKISYIIVILWTFWACQNPDTKQKAGMSSATPESSKDCIARIMAMDDSLGTIRNHACEKISLSKTIQQYIEGLEQLEDNACPKSFNAAFKAHRQAWRDMIALADQYPHLRGEMHDLFDQIEIGKDSTTFKPLLKAIWDTWGPIEAEVK